METSNVSSFAWFCIFTYLSYPISISSWLTWIFDCYVNHSPFHLQLLPYFTYRICSQCFEYFLSLEAEMHRESWIPVIILILSNLLRLPDPKVWLYMSTLSPSCHRLLCIHLLTSCSPFYSPQFRVHSSTLYTSLCDMLYNDLKPPLRVILRRVFIRMGVAFEVVFHSHQQQTTSPSTTSTISSKSTTSPRLA